MAILVVGGKRTELFADAMRQAAPALDIRSHPDTGRPEDIEYVLAWHPPAGLMASLPRLRLIVSVGAGVDHILRDPELPDVPVVRFVDPDLTDRMTAYVAMSVLTHHRRMTEFRTQQDSRTWHYLPEAAARDVRVGIMGLGVLGTAAAATLRGLGYTVRGWSRTAKTVPDVACFAGEAGLDDFLAGTDILVVLLPLTADTRGLIDARLLSRLSRSGRDPGLPGPVLINAGRGGLQVETDILAALDAGTLYAASLDVFETEPLPDTSRLWQHPRVVITPHCAAESNPVAIGRYAIAAFAAHRDGRPLANLVDPRRGY